MFLKDFTVGPLQVKAYLLACKTTQNAILFDPAGSEEIIANEISKKGFTLKYIVNTHGHPDHTCGNKKMKELTGAPVLMHKDDDELFRSEAVASLFRGWGFEPHPPCDKHINEGDIINVGNLNFKVIHTPGHSPGSLCFFGEGFVVTGDTLFVGGVGRYDLPGGDYDTLLRSLKDKVMTLPDDTRILPGHDYGDKPISTIKEEKKTNPYISQFF